MERGASGPGVDERAGGGNAEQFRPGERTAGPRASEGLSPEELSARRSAELSVPGHVDETVPARDDKDVHRMLPELSNEDLARLPILEPGTALEQGGTYLDLNDLGRGPFKAIGGQEAEPGNRYVPKRDTDYELWNRLAAGDREPEIERPAGAEERPG